jgi:protein O-mannosyl-transferase
MNRDAIVCLVLFCVSLLLFAPARRFELINYDDQQYVNDPAIRRGLDSDSLRWAFTSTKMANWHPLTWLSHMADAQLFGPDNAGAYHFVNALIHAVNASLLFVALRMMSAATWRSGAAAMLWAVHPLRVESVAWVAERKDLLCAMFFLLAVIAYVGYVRRKSGAAYAAVIVLFALALLSKPMAVTLPGVLLLLDIPVLRRSATWKKLLVEKIPLLVLALASGVITFVAQRQGGAMAEDIYPVPLRLGNALASVWRYLSFTFYPSRLSVFYPYEGAIPGTHLSAAAVVAGVACLAAGTIAGLMLWRRGNLMPLVGWLWFLGTLVPVIGLVQVGWQSMADRYMYIPHMGLSAALVWGAAALLPVKRAAPVGALATACVIAVVLSVVTSKQLGYWHDSIALFMHALDVTDHNDVAHGKLAQALDTAGDPGGAIARYEQQFRINPSHPQPLYNIGVILVKQNRPAEGQRYYERAIAIKPDYADAIVNLAHARSAQGDHAGAVELYRRGLQLKPEAAQARFYLALELIEQKKPAEAVEELRRARDSASHHADQTLVDEIDAQLSRPATQATGPATPATTPLSPPLPNEPPRRENPSP